MVPGAGLDEPHEVFELPEHFQFLPFFVGQARFFFLAQEFPGPFVGLGRRLKTRQLLRGVARRDEIDQFVVSFHAGKITDGWIWSKPAFSQLDHEPEALSKGLCVVFRKKAGAIHAVAPAFYSKGQRALQTRTSGIRVTNVDGHEVSGMCR